MDQSAKLKLPYIMASQAQKHVTHNEAIRALDALVQISVIDKDLSTPPALPNDGDRYIPAGGSTGAWAGKDGEIAAYQDGGWMFYSPANGWLAHVADEGRIYFHNGTDWLIYSDGEIGGPITVVNGSTFGSDTRFELIEEELTLVGANVDSAVLIPDRAIVFAVTSRTTQAISGAASYDCGIAGEIGKFGSALGITLGSSNVGVIGPTAFYADTALRLTANGSDFTGGKVRLAIHHMLCTPPTS